MTVIQRLVATTLPIIKPKISTRFVSEKFVILKRGEVEITHKSIDNNFNDIKFTREEETKIFILRRFN